MAKLLAMVESGKIKAVIVAKLDRFTSSVKDPCELLERFERRGGALVSLAESLDTGSAGRLVLNIMAAVSQWQWESEAIGRPLTRSHQAGSRNTSATDPLSKSSTEVLRRPR